MAERELDKLLAGLKVFRHEGVWQFKTTAQSSEEAIMRFKEREGWTEIVPADVFAPKESRFAWLELTVHSDLNAIGFLAAVSTALAEAGIPCNAVAAYHHDHVFVPEHLAGEAVRVIEALGMA